MAKLLLNFAAIFMAGLIALADACTIHRTPADLGGKGDVVYLDRHHIRCPSDDQLITAFGLKRPESDLIYYEYICCKVPVVNKDKCFEKVNSWSDTKDTVYLDRQTVDCGRNAFLKSIKLERENRDNRKMRYRYTCCTVEEVGSCEMQHTQYNDEGSGKVYYLDRHFARCPDNQLMQWFHLQRSYPTGYYRYDFVCCNIPFDICPVPTDDFEHIYTCDASKSFESMKCSFSKKVGSSRTLASSEKTINRETSQKLEESFKDNLDPSNSTSFYWGIESSQTFYEAQTFSVESWCSAGAICEMQQIVGVCSQYEVRANYFRLKSTRPNTRSVEYSIITL